MKLNDIRLCYVLDVDEWQVERYLESINENLIGTDTSIVKDIFTFEGYELLEVDACYDWELVYEFDHIPTSPEVSKLESYIRTEETLLKERTDKFRS